MSVSESECPSDIVQLDGNVSVCSSDNVNIPKLSKPKVDKSKVALSLPIVATYNLRSLMPKVQSLKNDLLERSVDIGYLQEIWEQTDNKTHQFRD